MTVGTAVLLAVIALLTFSVVAQALNNTELRTSLTTERAQHGITAGQVTYWRERCERLTDAALARAGAVSAPTMTETKPPAKDLAGMITSAMAVQEIDSREK